MMNKTIHTMFADTLASLASPSSVDTDQLSSLGVRLKVRIPPSSCSLGPWWWWCQD